eukprot:TRINITY_DN710_c1_g4_i1.p2 TRINITY_DN710_c1_g4~~TRINITY_DN710_c1_g4_i1.p2  ORF type:complete len:100 (-),score=15.42 TRINITY_DN710_c1_g4_i1:40-339(-)
MPSSSIAGVRLWEISSMVERERAQTVSQGPQTALSGKGCEIADTTRRLAQKQQSFKESVTAHWSSEFAPKMQRGSSTVSYTHLTLPTKRIVQISVVAGP